MAFSNGYTMGFAAAICVVCSLGVASASLGLRPWQDANKKREFQMQILTAVGVDASGVEDVDKLYTDRIEERIVNGAGEILRSDEYDLNGDGKINYLDVVVRRKAVKGTDDPSNMYPVFVLREGSLDKALAFEMRGKGLWGPISGYLALKNDGRTVLGVTFDAPKETPGLGAEIMYEKFRARWVGERIVNDAGEIDPVDVEKMCAKDDKNCVDGVSGATITCNGVDAMVEEALEEQYKNYIKQIQSGTGG